MLSMRETDTTMMDIGCAWSFPEVEDQEASEVAEVVVTEGAAQGGHLLAGRSSEF